MISRTWKRFVGYFLVFFVIAMGVFALVYPVGRALSAYNIAQSRDSAQLVKVRVNGCSTNTGRGSALRGGYICRGLYGTENFTFYSDRNFTYGESTLLFELNDGTLRQNLKLFNREEVVLTVFAVIFMPVFLVVILNKKARTRFLKELKNLN